MDAEYYRNLGFVYRNALELETKCMPNVKNLVDRILSGQFCADLDKPGGPDAVSEYWVKEAAKDAKKELDEIKQKYRQRWLRSAV